MCVRRVTLVRVPCAYFHVGLSALWAAALAFAHWLPCCPIPLSSALYSCSQLMDRTFLRPGSSAIEPSQLTIALICSILTARYAPVPRFIASYLAAALAVTFARFPDGVESRSIDNTRRSGSSVQGCARCLRELRDWFQPRVRGPHGLRPHCALEIRFSEADDICSALVTGSECADRYHTVQVRITVLLRRHVAHVPHFHYFGSFLPCRPYGLDVPYRVLFERFEAILMRTWRTAALAKAHHLRPDTLRVLYPRFDDFVALLETVDPTGLFRNEYVSGIFLGTQARSSMRACSRCGDSERPSSARACALTVAGKN